MLVSIKKVIIMDDKYVEEFDELDESLMESLEMPEIDLVYTNFDGEYKFFEKLVHVAIKPSTIAHMILEEDKRGTAEHIKYLRERQPSGKYYIGKLQDQFFLYSRAGGSIYHRTEKVKEILSKYMENYQNNGNKSIDMLVLACGDAEYAVSSIEDVKKKHPGIEVNATFLDIEEKAIKMAKENAEKRGIQGKYIHGDMRDILEYYKTGEIGKQDIITMKGICEYMTETNLLNYIKSGVKPLMKKNSILLTTNMENHGKFNNITDYLSPTKWRDYIVRFNMDVTKWLLDYKPREILEKINEDAGLRVLEKTYDESGLHGIVISSK